MNGTPHLPLAGPLQVWPQDVTREQGLGMLGAALDGLARRSADLRAEHELVTGADPALVAVVASWVRRGFEAGLVAGRAEVVEERPRVQVLQAQAAALGQALDRVRADGEALGQVVDDVVTAAAQAEAVVEDDTADARAALRTLLVRLERAAGPLTEGGRR